MENYENFLTNEDRFRLEMETYIPEFFERMNSDTMHDPDFMQKTIEMMDLAESAGINLQEYITNLGRMQGME